MCDRASRAMSRQTGKRRREPPLAAADDREKKLLPGELVEVISLEPGLCGSWHQAVVIGILENFRIVRYTDFVDENGSGSPLVENVQVSDAIDGKSAVPGRSTRGNIRPVLPHQPLQVSDASYGLCVDAILDGSYWEGVIADHAEGSMERKVLFPDEGDQRIMKVDQLRCSRDWDEVTGKWKPRGIWLFLQMVLSHEEKDGLPVSVRQIWYDLRSNPSFRTCIKMWMDPTEAFWERSLAALIADLWSVCGKPLQDGNQIGDSCRSTETLTSAAFENKKVGSVVLDKLDSTPALTSQMVSEYISDYRNNNRVGARAKLEPAKNHLKSLGWTFVNDIPKNKYCVSPDGKRYTSVVGACEAYLAQKETNNDRQDSNTNNLLLHCVARDNEDYGTSGMNFAGRENTSNFKLSRNASTSWQPEQLDAEFSPETVSLLAKYEYTLSQRRIDETTRMNLKKHLLALGWSIDFRLDQTTKPNGKSSISKRYRYKSPDGTTYSSIILVLRTLLPGCAKRVQGNITEDIPDNHNYLTTPAENLHATVSRDLARLGKRKCENKSDSIQKYVDYREAHVHNSSTKKCPRSEAKKFLKSAGWKWPKHKSSNKQEQRYHAPDGKTYSSLLVACKAYLEKGYQKEHNENFGITTDGCTHSSNLITLWDIPRDSVSVNRYDDMCTWPTCLEKSKKRKSSSASMSHARVLSSRHGQILPCLRRVKTVLSLLLEKNILLPRQKLTYKQRSDGSRIKEGLITRDGIKCMCCNEVFTLENFEVHAGCSTQLPSAHMFLKDGRSLSQCLVELMGENKPKDSLRVRLKKKYSDVESDSICSICNDGGEILLCDHCPSSFHHACIGLEATPEGSWYCPSCRCSTCDSSDYDPDTNQFTEKTIMYCDQCEHEYHVGCIRNSGHQLTSCPEGCWFCSRGCSKIFQHLQELIGKSIPTPFDGLSCTILRFDRENANGHGDYDDETMAEQYGKLCLALDVLHECFVTIIEPRTQRDLSEDIVFNRESELRRLNFRGFYTILLQKDGELISVGTFRVCGKKFAELPLIGTRVQYRRQGMCHILMNELEKLLCGLGVERLILPAVPEILNTWTGSFGFTKMSYSDRFELAGSSILSFQGTTMCQKILQDVVDHNPKDVSIPLVLVSERIEELKITTLDNSSILELAENSILSPRGTTMSQKVPSNEFSHPEELNGFDYQLKCASIDRETLESDSQGSTSMVVDVTDKLEPELLLEIRSNSGEQGSCAVDVPAGTPNAQVSFTGDRLDQPYGSSMHGARLLTGR